MRFHSLECHFGRLKGRFVLPPSGLTLVLEENEQGKTTLVEALIAALYGYGRNERAEYGLRERERYLPMDGAPCYIRLELTAGGRRLSIRRDLDGTAVERVRVIDLDTAADVTAALAPTKGTVSLGERLLGLNREQFLKVCFVRQGQVGDVHEAASLKVPVEQLVDTSTGERTANAAIDALDDARRHYHGVEVQSGLIDTELRRLEERLQQARTEQARLRAARDRIDDEARRLDRLESEERTAEEEQAALALLAERAELARLQGERQAVEEQSATLGGLRRQVAGLEQYRGVPSDGAVRLESSRAALAAAQQGRDEAEAAQRGCQREFDAEQARLQRMGAVAGWGAAERDEVVTWRGRLLIALGRRAEAEAAWQESLRNAGADAQRLYRNGRSPFDGLSDEDRRTLQRYPQELAERQLRLQQLRAQAAPAPAGRRFNLPVLLIGAALMVAGLVLLTIQPVAGVAVAAVGLLIAAAGLLVRRTPRPAEAAIEARALARREIGETEQRLQQLKDDGARLAALVGAANADDAAALLQAFLAAQGQVADLRVRQDQLLRTDADLKAAREAIAGLWTRAGMACEATAVEALDADRLLGLVDDTIQQQRRVEDSQRALDNAAAQVEAAEAKLHDCRNEWTARCAALGLPDADANAALPAARDMVEKRQLLGQAEGQLHLLAERAQRLPATDAQARIQELTDRIATAAAKPEIASQPIDRAESDYRDQARAVQERRDAGQRERQELRGLIGRVLDDYRVQMPQAIDAEQIATHLMTQVRAYRDVLDLALRTLQDVALESHRSWAETLNTYAAQNLSRLAPRYAQIRFDDQLAVRVIDADGHPWSPAVGQLSSGVRDRIYLAVRLALADYCSPVDDPLPLILDDPLVTSDDEQFVIAMRFILAEVATRHQVILASCHAQRHRAFMEQEPQLWIEHASVLHLTEPHLLGV